MNITTNMKGVVLWLAIVVALFGGQKALAEGASLKPFVMGSYRDIVSSYTGKPLIVSFWSITCPPCIAEMALWRDLHIGHAGVGLELVSTDSFEDEPRIRRTLKRQGLSGLGSWVFDDSFVERLRADVDAMWMGELPRTYLIGRDGRVEAHSGVVAQPILQAWIDEQEKP